MLLKADRVNQLEPGVKDLVTLVQNISGMRINPLLKAHPLGCTARSTVSIPTPLVIVVSLSGVLFARVVWESPQQSKDAAHMAVSLYLWLNKSAESMIINIYLSMRTDLRDKAILICL